MPRALTAILTLALLVAQVLPLGSVARGAVLCVSLDGHVAIEPVHATPVCDDLCGSAPEGEEESEGDHDDGCEDDHGCVDLQLGDLASPLEAGRAADDTSSVALGASAVCAPVTVVTDAAGPGADAAPTGGSRDRCALRTVILRL